MSVGPMRFAGLLLALSFMGGAAFAGSFSVSPIRLTLTAAAPIAALTIHNSGGEPTVVQLQVARWTQEDGSDHYQPSRDLIASPPIFTVPAGGSQIVRLALRRAPEARQELTYRVYLAEVPSAPSPGFVGTRVALELGVPVFVAPTVAGAQSLDWRLVRGGDGKVLLVARNSGALSARITSISLSSTAGGATSRQTIATDVHAGQQREWPLTDKQPWAAGGLLRLSARTERGDVEADVVVP
jgi:fimbrial chaperone protein